MRIAVVSLLSPLLLAACAGGGTPQWTAPLSDLLVEHIRELLSES